MMYAKKVCIILACITAFAARAQGHDDIAFLQQFINPGDLVFDVGANVGKKTDLYLACNARVVCIDPQPSCLQVLQERFAHNQSVIIEPVGLAQNPGILTLFICPKADTISTFSREWQQPHCRFFNQGYVWDETPIEVPVTTLDCLIAQHGRPAFCKIDVENFEYEVLQGLSQPIKYLSFEFAAEVLHNTKKCVDHLASLGYTKFNFAIAENPALALPQWVTAQEIMIIIEDVAKNNNWKYMWALWGDVYAHYDGQIQ
jgi:FkbM family methyltransferase